jgi:IclR family transcriptional regulator, acetate operon repressor
LDDVRRRGIAFSIEDYEVGVSGISAPVADAEGHPVAFVNVTGPSSRLSAERLEEVEPLVRDAASRLGRALGLRSEAAPTNQKKRD